jgi:hypothetical protein
MVLWLLSAIGYLTKIKASVYLRLVHKHEQKRYPRCQVLFECKTG